MDERLIKLKRLYNEIDKKIENLKKITGIRCIYGCGDCCERFEPFISVLEAWFVIENLSLDKNFFEKFYNHFNLKDKILCPFYNSNSPFHCSIYPIRPLICRLYGYAAILKNKKVIYSSCPLIKSYYNKEFNKALKLIEERKIDLPIFKEEYKKLCKIDFILATDLHPFSKSIKIALERLEDIKSNKYQINKKKLGKDLKMSLFFIIKEKFCEE